MGVAVTIRSLRVRSLDRDFHEISWELEPTSEDLYDFTFTVMRSEGPMGPFDPISAPFQDQYVFLDNVVLVGDRWRKYFYVIRVANVQTGDTQDFGPVSKDPDPDLIALEVRRHMQLLFQEFAGRRCWALPVRTFGQRCPCWNAVLKQRTRSSCLDCYNTGFVRGYMHPIESWMQIDPSPKTEQNTNVGAQQQSNTTARLAYFPPLKPRDLLIEPENRRWRVVSVSQTEQGRAALHQEVQIHEIPPRDIEFSIPLVLDRALKDMWLNPRRNYTNPQNLDTFFEVEFPNIVNLFHRKPGA